MSAELLELTDATFATEVLQSSIPVVVDFWATWCPPCIAMARTFADLAPAYAGRVKIVKVNVEVAVETGVTYNVRGLPNISVFNCGKLTDTRMGNQTKAQLAALLDKVATK